MSSKSSLPSLEQWQRLYALMDEVSRLAPWEFMYEMDNFGIRFPETGELGFVSVMGKLGEHFSIAVYIGKKGFEGFLRIESLGDQLDTATLLQVPQLQASFEDREMITPEDRKILKQLDLKFRGKNAWPNFRSYWPGCFPWYLEKEEAQILIHSLEQLLDVAPRFRDDPNLLKVSAPNGNYLVRAYKNGKWSDHQQKITFPADPPLEIRINMDAFRQLKSMKMQNTIVEVDLQMAEDVVKDKNFERPFFPFILMVVEQGSGMILGINTLAPLPSLEKMWGTIPARVVEILARHLAPKEIHVKDPLLMTLLTPFAEKAGFKVKQASRLPATMQIQRKLEKFQRRF
jgi:hypothetical protein